MTKLDLSTHSVRRKTVRSRSAMSLEALEPRLAPAGGLMHLMVPDFGVTEDVATRLTFRPIVGVDPHSRSSLTLEVDAGELRALSTPRVEVGGNESSTVKTFSGTADALNRYFARGKVTYVTPLDGNGPYRLTATSGCDCTVYPPAPCCGHPEAKEPADAGIIRVRPVNDRPTVASRATLPIVAGATSKTMTYDELKSLVKAQDVDSESLQLLVVGRSNAQVFKNYKGTLTNIDRLPAARRAVRPGQSIVVAHDTAADSQGSQFFVRAFDGKLRSTFATTVDIVSVVSAKYSALYSEWVSSSNPYWLPVTKMGSVSVTDGLGVFNNGTNGKSGIISETQGYAMVVAAMYGDQATFDRLSRTVQAGIAATNASTTKLFGWAWSQSGTTFTCSDTGSATDGDTNIALAYVYAAKNVSQFGWTTSTDYASLATSYIQAIRQYDFSKAVSNGSQYLPNAGSGEASAANITFHPDYCDPRAYQLFQEYDGANADFWQKAIDYTRVAYKAIFNFGATDPRSEFKTANYTGLIPSATSYTNLSNATYGSVSFGADIYSDPDAYQHVTMQRYASKYDADSCRLPVRLVNYLGANPSDTEMVGVASANLLGLGTTWKSQGYEGLVDGIPIVSPYDYGYSIGTWPESRLLAGLMLYAVPGIATSFAGDSAEKSTLYTKADAYFGTNGTNGTSAVVPTDNAGSSNPSWIGLASSDGLDVTLTLWQLTVGGKTPLQTYVDGI